MVKAQKSVVVLCTRAAVATRNDSNDVHCWATSKIPKVSPKITNDSNSKVSWNSTEDDANWSWSSQVRSMKSPTGKSEALRKATWNVSDRCSYTSSWSSTANNLKVSPTSTKDSADKFAIVWSASGIRLAIPRVGCRRPR